MGEGQRQEEVLGPTFELSLRLLILLDELDTALDKQTIDTMDFIALYGKDFRILPENLHGDGAYRFSEFPAREKRITNAIRFLAIKGLLNLQTVKEGFLYTISPDGKKMCMKLKSKYTDRYRYFIHQVYQHYEGKTATALKDIHKFTAASLEEVLHE